jgi:hypothetical protein
MAETALALGQAAAERGGGQVAVKPARLRLRVGIEAVPAVPGQGRADAGALAVDLAEPVERGHVGQRAAVMEGEAADQQAARPA